MRSLADVQQHMLDRDIAGVLAWFWLDPERISIALRAHREDRYGRCLRGCGVSPCFSARMALEALEKLQAKQIPFIPQPRRAS